MFTDRVTLEIIAGKGGNGVISWRKEKYIPKGGPYGGNGGKGGDVYVEADDGIYSLDAFRNLSRICAESGKNGATNKQQGATGKDLIIKVPTGTLIKDPKTGRILYDLTEAKQKILLCKGGKGGLGNAFFRSPTNQAPFQCTPGKEGEEMRVEFELKMIADVGLVGMPNAGKSTLLGSLSNVYVKTGAYPFTTLTPNISFIQFPDFSRIYIADIPGIIKGAHANKGLGLAFLKHIERTTALVYILDSSGVEGRTPLEDFTTLREEISHYDPKILERDSIIVLNKIDSEESRPNIEAFIASYGSTNVYPISALTGEGLEEFIEGMRAITQAKGKRYV